jgi:hypothetical protein
MGKMLSLVLLYAIHAIDRCASVQDCVSSCRRVKCAQESAGKRLGTSGKKIGNAHLTWAFSEAAVLFLHNTPAGQQYLARLAHKHGRAKRCLSWRINWRGPSITGSNETRCVIWTNSCMVKGSRAGEPDV